MKKWMYSLFGVFLAGMAVVYIVHLDPIMIAVGIALGLWSWRAFRAAGRHAPAPPEKPRPWER